MKRHRTAVFVAFAFVIGIFLTFSQSNLQPSQALAASSSSVQSGNWSDPDTWSGGAVPGTGDSVAINSGHTVLYDVRSDQVLGEITIMGALTFSRTIDTRLKLSGNLRLMTGGELDMGNEEDPIPASTRAEVIFVFPNGYQFTGGSTFQDRDKGIWAMNGTKWTTFGAPLLHAWGKLAQTATQGSSVLVVDRNVTDWYQGGQVVITQTSNPFRPDTYSSSYCEDHFGDYRHDRPEEKACNFFWENELRAITQLELLPDGTTRITLDQPLDFDHHSIEYIQGDVGLLTRNVLIRTEIEGVPDSALDQEISRRRFAHTMIMGSGGGTIQYTEFKYMGHLSTLARYPIHMHMTGSSGEGVVIRGNSVWRSGNRGYQVHNTHGVLIEDNVSFDTIMSPYYIERTGHPGETISNTDPEKTPYDNWFVHNLGVQSTKAPSKGQAQQNDDTIFWLDNVDNLFFGNVGVGAGSNAGTGIYPQGAEQVFSPYAAMWMDERSGGTGKMHLPYFFKNEMHSNATDGIAFWPQGIAPFEFVDFTSSRNGQDGIRWGYYRAPHKIFQLLAYENGDDGVGSDRNNRSGTRYVQDATLIGNRVGIMNGPDVVRPIYPEYPYTYIRPVFENNRDANIANYARIPGGDCVERGKDTPIVGRTCHANYVLMVQPEFKGGKPIDMVDGWQANVLGGNKNTMWRIKDAQGLPASFPDDFFLMRPDQMDPANRTDFTREFLVGSGQRLAGELDNEAMVVPVAPLPDEINPPTWGHSGANSGDIRELGRSYYYTWEKAVDVPPEVSIDVEMSGKIANVVADATDDKGVTRVEFYVDDTLVATDTSAPYQASIDLSEHPRHYGYIYAVAYDAHIFRHTTAALGAWDGSGPGANPPNYQWVSYDQKAYSKVFEVGPETLLDVSTLTVSRISPASSEVMGTGSPQTFTAGAEDSASNLSHLEWSVNGSVQQTTPMGGTSGQDSFTASFQFPTPTSLFNVVATVFDGDGNSRLVSWTVTAPPALSAIHVSPESASVLPGGTVQFQADGSDQYGNPFPVSPAWSASGGSIDQDGFFTDTSPEGGEFSITASSGSVSGAAQVMVRSAADLPSIPGRLEVEDYNEGGEGVGYHDTSSGNQGGQYRNDDVDLQATSDLGGGYNVGWVQDGEWLAYDVNVTQAGLYEVIARVASGSSGAKTFHLMVDGVDVTGPMSFSNGTGWQDWRDVSVSDVSLSAGVHQFKVFMDADSFNLNYFDFVALSEPDNQAPIVFAGDDQSVSLPNGVNLDATVTDDGRPDGTLDLQWTASGPGTVTFANSMAADTIASFPEEGVYTLTLTADDGELSSDASLMVTVTPENHAPVVDAGDNQSITLPDGVNLDATATDDGWPDGTLDLQWTASGPGTVIFADPSASDTSATFSQDGVYTLTLTADDGELSSDASLMVMVDPGNQAPVVNAGPDLAVTTSAPAILELDGSASDDGLPSGTLFYDWSAQGPAPVTFGDASAANTTATFNVAGEYSLTLTVGDGELDGSDSLMVTVNAQPEPGDLLPIPGRIEAEDYNEGGEGVAYHDATSGNSGGEYRDDDVDIQSTADLGGGYNVGWVRDGEWLAYDVDVSQSGLYDVTTRVATAKTGSKTFRLSLDGVDLAGTLSFSSGSGWQDWLDVTASGVALSEGAHELRFQATADSFNINYLDFAVSEPVENQAPTVDAGEDQSVTLPGEASLSGSAQDDGLPNGALFYQWSASGPGVVSFADAAAASTTASFSDPGEYVLTLTVSDGELDGFHSLVVMVHPESEEPFRLRIEAEDYQKGGEGVGYHDSSSGNEGGQYRDDDVDIQATSDVGGGYNVGWVRNGEWLAYDLDLAQGGSFDLTFRIASGFSGTKGFHLMVDGVDVTGTLSFEDNDGWQSWRDLTVSGVDLSAGSHELRFVIDQEKFNLNYFELALP